MNKEGSKQFLCLCKSIIACLLWFNGGTYSFSFRDMTVEKFSEAGIFVKHQISSAFLITALIQTADRDDTETHESTVPHSNFYLSLHNFIYI